MEVDAESERDAGGVSAADRVKEFAPEGAFIESLLRHASVRALIRTLLVHACKLCWPSMGTEGNHGK